MLESDLERNGLLSQEVEKGRLPGSSIEYPEARRQTAFWSLFDYLFEQYDSEI